MVRAVDVVMVSSRRVILPSASYWYRFIAHERSVVQAPVQPLARGCTSRRRRVVGSYVDCQPAQSSVAQSRSLPLVYRNSRFPQPARRPLPQLSVILTRQGGARVPVLHPRSIAATIGCGDLRSHYNVAPSVRPETLKIIEERQVDQQSVVTGWPGKQDGKESHGRVRASECC